MQFVTRSWSTLKKSLGLVDFETAYFSHFIHDEKRALLHIKKSRSDGFSLRSSQESLHFVKGPVTTQKKVKNAAWERSGNADHAMRLLTFQFFSYGHALLGTIRLYTVDNDTLLEVEAVKQLQCTAPPLLSVFACCSMNLSTRCISRPQLSSV